MDFRDLHHNLHVANALNTTAISANGTATGVVIDTLNYRGHEFVIKSGTLTDGTYTPSIEEGDASDLSDASAVAAGDLLGTIAGATFAATDDNAVKKIGYRGNKRYIRIKITASGVTSGGSIGAVIAQAFARSMPVS